MDREEGRTVVPVVIHYANGALLRCHATVIDTGAAHVVVTDTDGTSHKIKHRDLKAIFYVRHLAGDPEHKRTRRFPEGFTTTGKKLGIRFKDGERLVGVSHDYDPRKPGFHLVPADREGNNVKVYVAQSFVDTCVTLHG